jgi:ribosomal protein S18 acetylase RimI-like enzyme
MFSEQINDARIYFRKAETSDFNAVKDLGYLAFSTHKKDLSDEGWQKMKSGLTDKDKQNKLFHSSRVFVAENEAGIVGAAFFLPSGCKDGFYEADWCQLRMVSVHPRHRGKGIGRKLTELCIEEARERKEKKLALHTSEVMTHARKLYESLGFKELKEIDPLFGIRYWLFLLDLDEYQSD